MKKRKIRQIAPYRCPSCKKNLRGKKIPKYQQHLFGVSHFGLENAIYDRGKDCTIALECPFCRFQQKVR